MNESPDLHPGMALGSVFLTLFGAIWLAGASVMVRAGWPVVIAITALAAAILAWALTTFRARRLAYAGIVDDAAKRRLRRGFMLVNAVQWALIGLAVGGLNAVGHGTWITPAVIFLVGVHFVPLARLLGYRGYYWTAAGLVLVAGCHFLIDGERTALALGATGVVLWASAVRLLWAMRERGRSHAAAAPRQVT